MNEPSQSNAAKTANPDGVWHFLNEPRGFYRDGEIWTGYVTSDGGIIVGRFDSNTGQLVSEDRLRDWLIDDHLNPTLLHLPEKDLVLATMARNSNVQIYRATTKAELLNWQLKEVGAHQGVFSHLLVHEDRLFLFYRGQSGPLTQDSRPHLSWSEDWGETWRRGVALIAAGEWLYPKAKRLSDGQIHLIITSNPFHRKSNPLYYIRFDGEAFYRADGERIGTLQDLPFKAEQFDAIYPGALDDPPVRASDISLNAESNPVVYYVDYGERESRFHEYRTARWSGEEWVRETIASSKAMSELDNVGWVYFGGLCAQPHRPDCVYNSVSKDGRFVIREYCRNRNGEWINKRKVVESSHGKDALRPWVVTHENRAWLTWLEGNIERLNDFKTAVRVLPLKK